LAVQLVVKTPLGVEKPLGGLLAAVDLQVGRL
jgi:hypothetical protein